MAPCSIPAPHINPVQVQTTGTRRIIDTSTKIELVCDTYMNHEVFYTIDGTKPQPYAGIVQGSRMFKYSVPFCLPQGKISVKAIALNSQVRTIRSNVVTKEFHVLKSENDKRKKAAKKKKKKSAAGCVSTDLSVQRKLFGSEDVLDRETDDGDVCLNEPATGVEGFPVCFEPSEDEVTSESGQSVQSAVSAQEGEDPLNVATCESAPIRPLSSAPQSPVKKPVLAGSEDGIGDAKPASKSCGCNLNSGSPPSCMKCGATPQICPACNITNDITSKFCIQCGKKLMLQCALCKEFNFAIATFCQFCGQKLQLSGDVVKENGNSSPVKPQKHHKGVQMSPSLSAKQTQTLAEKTKDKSKPPLKLPSHSPGRGYWHQQLDYVCNHLKSHAYNNNEFRDSISEPMLGEFQSAKVAKTEDSISITLKFSPFTLNEKL